LAGYSGTPLAKKLGLKEGTRLYAAGAPRNYLKGVRLSKRMDDKTDIIHLFATQRARLAEALRGTLKKMKSNAAIWVSWPKKASKVQTDITEDTIREIALPMGLVDIKVCAVDETWSGLKLVIRKELRK
jgi:hypothetical protein